MRYVATLYTQYKKGEGGKKRRKEVKKRLEDVGKVGERVPTEVANTSRNEKVLEERKQIIYFVPIFQR